MWIVEDCKKDQVCNPCEDCREDNVVVVEDVTSYRDHVSVGEIPLEDQRGHVDDEVERVDADHEVPVRRRVPAKWAAEAEHVGVRYVDCPGRFLDQAF